MGRYKDAIYLMGLYLDPSLLGDDPFEEWDNDSDGDYEEMGQVFRILLDEDLVKVYWTENDKFYLEDSTV